MLHLKSIECSKGSLLYFAIAAVGNHFTSSAKMLEEGKQLLDRVWNAVLACLDEVSDQDPETKTSVIQAAILVQTCALLSDADSYLSDAGQMHSKIVSCVASIRLYAVQHEIRHPGAVKAADCHSSWQSWLSTEEKSRTVLALFHQDAELAAVYHRPPLLDHHPSHIVYTAPDDLFTAPTSDHWAALFCPKKAEEYFFMVNLYHNCEHHCCYHRGSPTKQAYSPTGYTA